MITLIFRSKDDAETAWVEHFEESSEVVRATLKRLDGTIEVEPFQNCDGETHIEIPEGCIAIVI